MPSVMGLLEERERAVRQRVEALQVELLAAEAVLERFVIACETVSQVLAEPREDAEAPGALSEVRPVAIAGAVPRSVVPVCAMGSTRRCWRPTISGSWRSWAAGPGRVARQ